MRINSIGECVHGQADATAVATALLITLIRSPHKGLHTSGTTTESMDITAEFRTVALCKFFFVNIHD